ncbi:MAG TPA: heavy metal transporter [Curvibacter sp.]|nr:heavy metal transporter [Curvibacter sp.]|tara:strand:+ start:969 stop:1295 length:327 start_codon:yes stop_codon:yes gene_type:complete
MNKFILTLALSLGALPAYAASTLKVTVNGMVCAFCAQGIEKRVGKMPATQEVFVDLKNKIVAVQARPGQALDAQAIRAEIVDSGYDVVKIEPVSQSVADIKAELKARK